MTNPRKLIAVPVWDAATRWFHWINFLAVLALVVVGLVIMYGGALGIDNDGKVLLKTIHVWVGYVFLVNLLWRLVWAFLGNRWARWRAFLPGGRGFFRGAREYVVALLSARPQVYVGHNPLGRLFITLMLLVLLAQGLSGLVLAGTDLYYPPFGGWIAEWIAAPGVDPAGLAPYRPDLVDADAYDAMRNFRGPFIETHEILFYVILALVVIHIAAVVFTELWEGGGLISAMFTGRKVLDREPVDLDVRETDESPSV